MTLPWEHFVNPFEQTEDSDFNITKTTNASWLEVSFVSYWHAVKMFPFKSCWSTFDTDGCLPVGMWYEWLSCLFVFFVLFWSIVTKSNLGKFYFILQPIIKESQDRNSKQDLRQPSWRNATVLLTLFYIYRGPPAKGWRYPQWAGPSTSVINQENAPQVCLQPSVVGDSFSWGSLFSDDSSLS